jgi:hypothetical protein
MWESGPWLGRCWSPEWLPWWWLLGLAWASLAGSRRLALGLRIQRAVVRLALLQSAAVTLALAWGARNTSGPTSANDVYVVCAALCAVSTLGCAAFLLLAPVPDGPPALGNPAVPTPVASLQPLAGWISGRGLLLTGGASLVLLLPALLVVPVLWVFLPKFETSSRGLAAGLAGAFGAAAIGASCLLRGGRPQSESTRRWLRPLGLALMAPLLPVSVVLWFAAPRVAMTDGALVSEFDRHIEDDAAATPAFQELRRRGQSRFSALARYMAEQRSAPQYMSGRVGAQMAKTQGYPGCSGFNLESLPYRGKPEVDLLAILVARGEPEVAREWVADEQVDEQVRADLVLVLAGKPYARPPDTHD